MDEKLKAIVTDANVIIDYITTGNKHILRLACDKLCELHIPLPVAYEIKQITIEELRQLGFIIDTPEMQQMKEAVLGRGKLSFQDMVCFLIARDNKWVCATSDKLLKSHCTMNGIETIWGLELMKIMCMRNVLDKNEAIAVATEICTNNKRMASILPDFIDKLVTI